jgi:hydroxyacylglutathione hydrolase
MTPSANQHTRLREFSGATIVELCKNGATAVDLRDAVPFGAGHLPDSIHIKVKSPDFADRISRFTRDEQPLVFIADSKEDADWAEAELMGVRKVAGYVVGAGAFGPSITLMRLPALSPEELFAKMQARDAIHVLDVREPSEWEQGFIAGARHIPMNNVLQRIDQLPKETPIAIACAGGQRSSLIASLLLTRGFTKLFNVTGGMKAWTGANFPVDTNS